MKNNRTMLKEDQTVNEVQLKDLYDLSSKTEREIITLVQTAINFSDLAIKNKALALKSQANELVTMIGNQMMQTDLPIENVEATVEDPAQKVVTEPKQQIEQPSDGTVIESLNLKESRGAMIKQLKTLLEALEPELLLDEEPVETENEIDLEKEEIPTEDVNEEQNNVIDLSSPFQEIFDAAETTEFMSFKDNVLQILSASEYASDPEFMGIITNFEAANDSLQFDQVMTELYDWADNQGIEIFTI